MQHSGSQLWSTVSRVNHVSVGSTCRDQVLHMNQSMYQETLFVRLADVKWYDAELAETIQLEWLRLEPYLKQAVQQLVKEVAPDILKDQDQNDREFSIAWEGIERIDRLRDLRSAKVRGACANESALRELALQR
jgi:DNA replicative helicase MCM subunit Mcm2 (Cdc46/Mcm family)